MDKPLGHKAYGSIPHLPGSKRGPGDHGMPENQAAILLGKRKVGKCWKIVVQEKLDGSCMSVAKIHGQVVALGRAGYLASSSPYRHCRLFAEWVEARLERFDKLLLEGERVVGEWLLLAHSIRYWIVNSSDLFVAFDIMRGHDRVHPSEVVERCALAGIRAINPIYYGEPTDSAPQHMHTWLCNRPTFASDQFPEGLIYRGLHHGKVVMLAKWVRSDFEAGRYLSRDGVDIFNFPPEWIRDGA